jgi:ankyrin repeat protein
MLAATSYHPQQAGVQIALLALLLSRGAVIDGVNGSSTVNVCLANGRGHAAEYLAEHGASLDMEGAAGVGRLDVMESAPRNAEKMRRGFAWACEFGRTEAAAWLLNHGVAIDAKLPNHQNTGLHWAAYGGHPNTVRMLLARGAPIEVKDEKYDGTPLGWAKHGRGEAADRGGFDDVIDQLQRAGAKPD